METMSFISIILTWPVYSYYKSHLQAFSTAENLSQLVTDLLLILKSKLSSVVF